MVRQSSNSQDGCQWGKSKFGHLIHGNEFSTLLGTTDRLLSWPKQIADYTTTTVWLALSPCQEHYPLNKPFIASKTADANSNAAILPHATCPELDEIPVLLLFAKSFLAMPRPSRKERGEVTRDMLQECESGR